LLVLALVPSLLPGCSNPYSQYENRNDVCYDARAPLIAMGTDFQKTVLGATAVGAAGGALAGFAIGRGRSLQDVLIGAAAGALTGSLVGYLQAKRQAGQSQSQVLYMIDQDAAHDRNLVSASGNAITNLINCRDAQTRSIEAAYTSRAISRDQAIARYHNVQAAMREDDRLIAQLLGAADEREAKYVSARADEMSLRDPARAASSETLQLNAARQNAAVQEAVYRQHMNDIDRHVAELEKAVG
jgi:outer membrane lipoprotein SlyB